MHIAASRRLVAVTWGELVEMAPDTAYGASRERGDVDWFAVADILDQVVSLIAEPPAFRKDRGFSVSIPGNFGARERMVVESWFTTGPAPTLDVVHGSVDGCAEWPFEVWAINSGAALPFDLAVLREVDEVPRHSATFRRRIAADARSTLAQLPTSVRWRSPLASAALTLAGRAATATVPRPSRGTGDTRVRRQTGPTDLPDSEA